MICPSCGSQNVAGAKFCVECGSRLAASCPACGTANAPGAKFCLECGTRLVEGAGGPVASGVAGVVGGPAPAVTVAERRLVSVLFADLVDFTALSADRDPEETRDLLSRYFDLSRDVITRYGGTIEKFIGDAVMAVWGAPVAQEDDAERAVRAGMELVDVVKSLAPGIQARAGVLSGEAAVTLGAAGQGMVAGDLVNTASRLQSVASPGSVLVGEATRRAADRAIVFETAGEQVLKGKPAPIAAWRAVRVVAERGGRNRAETLEAPFVGRDEELRRLKDLFHSTSRERRPRLVSVVGPAGIGKTRLAWEFLKYVDGLLETVWWHDGRSPAYGEGITFWALGEMIRGRCRLLEADDEPTTRARVAETLAQHVPDEAEQRWLEPALLALLGVGGGSLGSDQLFAAWRTFFERLSASGPVVLVFEDLHFADSGLLDFIDHLLEWSRGHPIYVLTLARPELLEKRPDWGAGKRDFTSVYLEPLTDADMRELLAGLVPGLPEPAVRAIVQRADGVPLYAVETVRMLVAEGRLSHRGDVYVPTGDLTELAVPESLTALIASRLDALPPEDRALVADAAVLGQSFTLAAVAAVAGAPEADVELRMRALARREIVALEADPRSPERGQYVFVQALIREVAYRMLAKADRKTRHLAAARFFEGLGSEELAGALAGQYLSAYRSAGDGPEADALASQARVALRAAATRAANLGSHEQALSFVTEALTVTSEPSERAALLIQGGRSAAFALGFDAAERYYREAIELDQARGDIDRAMTTTAALGHIMLTRGQVSEAIELLQPAVQAAEEVVDGRPGLDGAAGVRLMGALARAYDMGEQSSRALEWTERLLPIAERLDLADQIATGWLGRMRTLRGRRREIDMLLQAALDLALVHDLPEIETRARTIRTFMSVTTDPRLGLADARTGLERARRLGSRFYTIAMIGNGVDCAFRVGEWDWAVANLRDVLDADLEGAARIELGSDLARFLACRGEDVSGLMAEIEPLLEAISDRQYQAYRWLSEGWRALAARELPAAAVAVDRALTASTIFTAVGQPLAARVALWSHDVPRVAAALEALERLGLRGPAIDADRATIRAGLAALAGDATSALRGYREALDGWHDAGLRWDAALCVIDMLEAIGPGEASVTDAVEEATGTLRQLGARPFLDRLEGLASGAAEPGARARPGERRQAVVATEDRRP